MRTLTESETCTLANALRTAAAQYATHAENCKSEPRIAEQFARQHRETIGLAELLEGLPTVTIHYL